MAMHEAGTTIKEAVGVFADLATLEQAIDELEQSGFDRAEISLLTSRATVEDKLRHLYAPVEDLEDDPDAPRKAYVSTESIGDAEGALIGGLMYIGALAAAGAVVASGGTLAAVITGAALAGGSGALIGGGLARLVGNDRADEIEQQLMRGGLLLWVRTRDREHETRAVEILKRNSAHDVHIHELPVS